MNQITRLIFATLILFGYLCASALGKPVRVGISLPLSGSVQILGKQFLEGAKLAAEAYNSEHPTPVLLAIEDDACNRDIAEIALENLRQFEPVVITGFLCNEPAYLAADMFKEDGLPLLIAGAQSDRLIKDREYEEWKLWKLSPGDNAIAKQAASVLSNKWRDQPYAIIDDGSLSARALTDAFRSAMEAEGNSPAYNDTYRPNQSNQNRLIYRLRNAGVSKIFIGGNTEDIALIANNVTDHKYAPEIAGGQSLSILPFLPDDKQPPAGLIAFFSQKETQNTYMQALTDKLKKRGIEAEPYVYLGYAALQIAINAADKGDRETAIAKFNNNHFDTVLGPVSFSGDGRNLTSPFAMYEWQGDKFVKVSN